MIKNNLEPSISDCITIVEYFNDILNNELILNNPDLRLTFYYNGLYYGIIWNNIGLWSNIEDEREWNEEGNDREKLHEYLYNKIKSYSLSLNTLFN
jgi:hypothetical protein